MRVIAIDGPAGSGKSTVARAVAERLGLGYLDTGAMYRSVAFAALRRGIDPEEADQVGRIAEDLELDVDPDGTVTVDGDTVIVEVTITQPLYILGIAGLADTVVTIRDGHLEVE